MGLMPIYQAPKTSAAHPDHKVYPYLLRDLTIDRPNQVWCADITYIPMRRGFLYLVAIMDWHSRKVLSWRLSNTMDVSFCIEALKGAFNTHGVPAIFNTDQGSQFTSLAFTEAVKAAGAAVSMDGKGRWMDNVFIERLWRSLKYECVYLHAPETGSQARAVIGTWIDFYNRERPHSTFDGRTPDAVYNGLDIQPVRPAAA
jgi:putative transposase